MNARPPEESAARRGRDPESGRSTPRRWRRLLIGLVAVALLVTFRVAEHHPIFPNPLTVDLTLEPGEPGRADPLIVAGRPLSGDFLSVVFDDAGVVRFKYDSWGHPGIMSSPVALQPGAALRLTLTLPAFAQVRGGFAPASNRVRVECDGRTVLDQPARFFVRERSRIFFARNPIGGTACGPELRGRIIGVDGRVLQGGPETIFTVRERLTNWLTTFPLQLPVLIVCGILVVGLGDRLPRGSAVLRAAARHRWFTGSAVVATAGFAWLATYGTFRFDHEEVFGAFFDYQVSALLRGRLDVPEDAIGGEAFESRGKLYGYFGPTPALARLPLALTGFAFGQLARAFMTLWFAASLLAAYLIFQHARARIGGLPNRDVAPAGPFPALVLVGGAGLGSTLFFLGSRSFMYHEAILAGIAFALWSVWCTLRHVDVPAGRWWVGALACGVLSLHARPPTGLFALCTLGAAVILSAWADWRGRAPGTRAGLLRPAGIGFACFLGLLTLNGLAWLKFRTFDAAPLHLSRPYTGDPNRLEHIGGRNFHLVNLSHNFDTYFRRPNLRFERGFPWIYLGSTQPRREFPDARIDLADHTLSLPYAMPGLFLLATVGSLGTAVFHLRLRTDVSALVLAALPMTLALLAAIATAHRYTGDFCPILIAAGSYGLAGVESIRSRWRRLAQPLVALATLASIAITLALTLHYQGETLWGMPDEVRNQYQDLRRWVDAAVGAPAQ